MTPSWFTRPFGPGDQGEDVRALQLLLRAEPSGYYDDATTMRVRGYRLIRGLPPRGDCDDELARAIGELR